MTSFGKLSTVLAPVALSCIFAVSAVQADVLTEDKIDQLDKTCEVISQKTLTRDEARPCLEAFYDASVSKVHEMSGKILNDLRGDGGKIESSGLDEDEAFDALEYYILSCKPVFNRDFSEFESAEHYLRAPQFCLAEMSNAADRYNLDYDREGAGFLINRLKLLRRLDLEP